MVVGFKGTSLILKQMMLCVSGLLVIPFLISNFVCAGSATIQLRFASLCNCIIGGFDV